MEVEPTFTKEQIIPADDVAKPIITEEHLLIERIERLEKHPERAIPWRKDKE